MKSKECTESDKIWITVAWEMQIDSAAKGIDYKKLLPIKPHSTLHHTVQICLRLAHLPPAALALYSRFRAKSGAG